VTVVNKAMKNDDGSVLTIYYSYSGNTRKIASEIHQVVGGNIVEIEPIEPYPKNYNAVVDQARRELRSGYKPKLKAGVENIASYDTIFLGSPNWWHTIAPPVITFLSESDLSGKVIIPFITHGGGGLERSAMEVAALCPGATVLKSLAVFGADVKAAQKWLSANWPI
jgi:flavodoxin